MRVERTTFVCERPGRVELPEVVMPWFDLDAGEVRAARVPAVGWDVTAAPATEDATLGDAETAFPWLLIGALLALLAGLAVFWRPLAARIGIATGLVVVGDLIGEGAAQEEAVIGETPNRAARLQALADDAMTTAVATRYELAHRPEGTHWLEWIDKQKARIARTIDAFEPSSPSFADSPTIGEIAVACLLDYVAFRTLDEHWRERTPALAQWFQGFEQRPSMLATRPV